MSLFAIEGWSVSAPIETEANAAQKSTAPVPDNSKKTKKQPNKKHAGGNSMENTAPTIDNEKVSSEDLQRLFELQFKKDVAKGSNPVTKSEEENNTRVEPARHEKTETLKRKRDSKKHSKSELKVDQAAKHKSKPSDVAVNDESRSSVASRPAPKLTPLQQKMKEKLAGSRFRWINEKLYTVSSDEAKKLLKDQPDLYREYHEGFRQQIQSWPENPVNIYIERVNELSKSKLPPPKGLPRDKDGTTYIADMGCGDAELSLKVSDQYSGNKKQKKTGGRKIVVHSFDLSKTNERVTVADIKNVPLPDSSVHIVVFCLSLMGTNFLDFVKEANRILKPRGQLWISEIKSRFSDNDGADFINAIKAHRFVHTETDTSNLMFIRFDFFKPLSEKKEARPGAVAEEPKAPSKKKLKFIERDSEPEDDGVKTSEPLLKPCLYKKR
ncbi:methyltransferase-domain-containing protein [Lipomyces tetrasporus]